MTDKQQRGGGRQRSLLVVLSLLCLFTLGVIVWRERGATESYGKYQRRHRELMLAAGREAPPSGPLVLRLKARGKVDRCLTCHRGITEPPLPGKVANPHRSHPGKLLTWHPPRRFGCTACHGAGGGHVDRCLPASGDPDGRALDASMAQASCRACHRQAEGLSGTAALTRGISAYRRLGCGGCHREDRLDRELGRTLVGPPLDGVGAKLRPAYLGAFLSGPQRIRPGTAMPTFFDDQVTARAPAFTSQHVRATRITRLRSLLAFLLQPKAAPAASSKAQHPSGDARAGAALATSLGCVACHRFTRDLPLAARGASGLGTVGPDLSAAGARLRLGWTLRWLAGPRRVSPDARMPDLRLGPQERADLVAFLSTLGEPAPEPPELPPASLAPAGKKLARQLGCAGCHRLRSLEGSPPAGPELDGFGDKPLDMLDWGHFEASSSVPPAKRTTTRWIRTKLTSPLAFDRRPGGVLSMPWQHLRPGEQHGLVLLLRGLTRAPAPAGLEARPSQRSLRLRRGARLVGHLGCRQCHQVGGRGGEMKALLPRPSDRPPSLDGEGAKVLPSWLFGFLRQPAPLRPWLRLRMPTFNLTPDQARDLAAYLAASARASYPFADQPAPRLEGNALAGALALFEKLKCVSCHKLSNAPRLKPGELAPDLALSGARLRRAWIRRFILEPQKVMPGTRMPTLFPLVDEDEPAGPRITPAPDLLGGRVDRQVDALTDLNLRWGRMARLRSKEQ